MPPSLPMASPPADRGRWLRWVLLGVLMLSAVWGISQAQKPTPSSDQVRWVLWERLAPRSAQAEPGTTSERVTLPDSWKAHGLPPVGDGLYRLVFELSAQGVDHSISHPWSLRIDRLCAAHDVFLNQRRLHSTLITGPWLGEPAPALLDIPGGMLQAGRNELRLEVRCTLHGGLSLPSLAPKASLQGAFVRHQILTQYLPLALNLCSMAFAVFVIWLWWLRRQEAAAGLFGMLYLLVSVRNCTYYVTADVGISPALSSWLYLTAHVGSAVLLGWFALTLSKRDLPWFNRLLWAVALGAPLVALAALWVDPHLNITRAVLQPGLQLLALPSLWILLQLCRQLPMRSLVVLLLGFISVLVSALHDLIGIRILGLVDHSYWMPWTVPLTLPGFTMMLMNRVVKAFNDIEQVNLTLEQKVQERTRELAAVNAAKSHFLAAASHDLRQPVSAIGLITDLLHERMTDPSLRGLTDRLTRAVVSMESLLKGLLDLSRLDSGTVEVHAQHVQLQTLLDSIASHETESAHHKGLSLRVRPTTATAWTDPILLEQILRNLVGNAVRHTERGGILVGVRSRDDHLLIQVWDTGSGISAADQARIFDEFVQLSNPGRERRRGLGLGLAIVKRAAKLLHHPIHVQSRTGKGSCFSVRVPRAPTEPPHEPDPLTPGAPHSGLAAPWVGLRALVVEDDQTIRDALSNHLRSWGFAVTSGASLNWLRAHGTGQHWDLVISDHRLSDGTGRDVVQLARAHHPRLAALIVTGDTSPEQISMLAQSGLPVLHKPFRAKKLRAMIEETMARR
ncbi:MAG: ATP-binding protein [Acidobacteriota bacterium]